MGGINFTIYINGDRNLNIQDTLNKFSSEYSLGAKLLSEDFSELIMKKVVDVYKRKRYGEKR